jgi:hypothetical protein
VIVNASYNQQQDNQGVTGIEKMPGRACADHRQRLA